MATLKKFIATRAKSFAYAFRGIFLLFSGQVNARIHLLAVVVITAMGFGIGLSALEWCLIVVCMVIVLLAEGINTALEHLTDLVSPEHHPLAGNVKDVAAGAVLLSVIGCGVVWGIIFLPKIFALWV